MKHRNSASRQCILNHFKCVKSQTKTFSLSVTTIAKCKQTEHWQFKISRLAIQDSLKQIGF